MLLLAVVLSNISETKKSFFTNNQVKTVSAGATESDSQLLRFFFLWLLFPFMAVLSFYGLS